jgi:hypothetical protein
VGVPDVALAARLAVDVVESLVHRVVTDGDSGVDDDRFRAELVRLVVGYLGGAPGGAGGQAGAGAGGPGGGPGGSLSER